jgi:tRNA-splicing ligase RtcB
MSSLCLKKISEYIWKIPKAMRPDMRVPAKVFSSDKLIKDLSRDRSIEQLINVTTLPGIQKEAVVMPDAHEGYGFPIGAVAGTCYPDGAISPGGIGYDINCGVRLLLSKNYFSDIQNYAESLTNELFKNIPSGVGKGGCIKIDFYQLNNLLKSGLLWAEKNGYALGIDKSHVESNGVMKDADPETVSDYAKKRGKDQVGTLGAGNHFVEIGYVEKIFDEGIAKKLGLFLNQVTVLIHTGSRGFGHQVATDYIKVMQSAMQKYKITVADKELACSPFSSEEGQRYFKAMQCACNFAFCNRQLITYRIREVWRKIFSESLESLKVLYDVCHNIAKIEEYKINAKLKKLIVHRKGATRSFPPNHEEIPIDFQETGQPVIIPGSMGTASYVLVGQEKSMELSFGSTCHGAGRQMSRKQAKKEINSYKLLDDLKSKNIFVKTDSLRYLSEEAPIAYKNIHNVVNIVHNVGIAKKVAELKPYIVIKG